MRMLPRPRCLTASGAVEIRGAPFPIGAMCEGFSVSVEGIDEQGLAVLVDRFYAKVRRDMLIGPVFERAIDDWPEHLERLQAFWSSVMLTSGRYKGRPLPAHVKHGDSISQASFERWLALWKQATEEVMPPAAAAALQDRAARIAESLSLGIEFARGEAITAAAGKAA